MVDIDPHTVVARSKEWMRLAEYRRRMAKDDSPEELEAIVAMATIAHTSLYAQQLLKEEKKR